MSGIGAVFYRSGKPVDRAVLDRFAQALRIYGPEYKRTAPIGPVGLVYSHLANSPQSMFDEQPISGAASRWTMVFDGRLDNRDEIAKRINFRKADLESTADSALALHCWEQWGMEAPSRWVGEFACVVWDARDRKLYAARDQFGLRTLSYYQNEEIVILASSPKAIFTLDMVPRRVDMAKIEETLVDFYPDATSTYFVGLKKVAPAHVMVVDAHVIRSSRFWDPSDLPPVIYKADSDYVDAGRDLLLQAVRSQIRSAGKVGAFLTSGLDSTSVAITALDCLEEQTSIPTFTWVPDPTWDGKCGDGRTGDETLGVQALAHAYPRLDTHFVSADCAYDDRLQEYFSAADSMPLTPFGIPHIFATLELAKKEGVTTLVGGDSGNLTLSWDGRGIYLDLLMKGLFGKLFNEMRAISPTPYHFMRRILSRILLPLSPDWLWGLFLDYTQGTLKRPYWRRYSALNPAFAERSRLEERARLADFNFFFRSHGSSREMRIRTLTENFAFITADYNQAFRAMSGIEMRDPLLDRRLVEWCLGVPEEQYLRNGEQRCLIKRIMAQRLPNSILQSTKRGLYLADINLRMTRALPRLKEQISIFAEDPELAPMMDTDRLRKSLDRLQLSEPSYSFADQYFLNRMQTAISAGQFVRWAKGANR